MKIAISGHTGYIGTHVKRYLSRETEIDSIEINRNDFQREEQLERKIRDADIILNFAGYPVIKRWNAKNKRIIHDSRIDTTTMLADAAGKKTKIFINASAIGIYDGIGSHDDYSKAYAHNFLARVVKEWEQALKNHEPKFEYIAMLRFGVVIGKNSPSWKMMKMPYKMKIGVQIGHDDEYFSFIRVEEIPRVIEYLIKHKSPGDVINVVCPGSVLNKELDKVMKTRYGSICSFRLPNLILRMLYGEAAIALVESKNIVPRKLENSSFNFRYSSIEESISDI